MTDNKEPLEDDPYDKDVIEADPEIVEKINSMSHFELARLWREAPLGHPWFQSNQPYHKIFHKRLFGHFGGITPEISKAIGW